MARTRKDDGALSGLGLAARFSLAMTLALAVVMAGFGFFLFRATRDIVDTSVEDAMQASVRAMADDSEHEQVGETAKTFSSNRGKRFDIRFTTGHFKGEKGTLYQYNKKGDLLAPARGQSQAHRSLLGLFLGMTAMVILVGAYVAYVVATKVSKPIEGLVDDVRQISRGNLQHRSRVRGGGEVALLARSIDRMAGSLQEAQEAEVELGVREREIEVAQEVRDSLLPDEPPTLPGYEIANLQIGSPEPGGDFHDFVPTADGVVLLLCEVSGQGVPGALVGATARAYLRSEMVRSGDLVETLRRVNQDLARDVRRGMYVTALCVAVDPGEHVATVACAGHKIPLVRYSAAEKKVRLIHPEGIALGFDKGPVFEQRLQVQRVPMEPGDRLVLANTGPVRVLNPAGEELGEKELYRSIMKYAGLGAQEMLAGLETRIEAFAEDEPFPADISITILAREDRA